MRSFRVLKTKGHASSDLPSFAGHCPQHGLEPLSRKLSQFDLANSFSFRFFC